MTHIHLCLPKTQSIALSRAVQVRGHIAANPVLGGLHHQYCRIWVFDRDRTYFGRGCMQLPLRQGEAHRVIAATRGHDATGDGMAGDREPSGPTGQGL